MEAVNKADFRLLCETGEKEIGEIYQDWKKALINTDIAFLQTLYSEDFRLFSPMGMVKNKSEVLTRLSFKDVSYLSWDDLKVLIDVKGAIATVRSHQSLSVELYSLPMKIDREITMTFLKDCDRWLLKDIRENAS